MKSGLLLSGGVDSSAVAFWLRPSICFAIDYGQLPAPAEIQSSQFIASQLNLQHEVIRVNCAALGSGDLAGRPPLEGAHVSEWWPFRNQLLITLCAIKAVEFGVEEILVGTVRTDGIHRDGTKDFFSAIDRTLACQEGGIRVRAPAIQMTSTELVLAAGMPLAALPMTHSCHTGCIPCSRCRGCQRRFATFQELGLEHPVPD